MECRTWLVVALLLLGSLTPARAFVIQKRAPTETEEGASRGRHKRASYPTEEELAANRLADALELIQRERRRLANEVRPPFEEEREPIPSSFYDEGGYVSAEEPTAEDVQEFLASLLNEPNDVDLEPQEELALAQILEDEDSGPQQVDADELEDIFAPSEDEEAKRRKKDMPVSFGDTPKREYDPSQVVRNSNFADAELSDEEVEKLLAEVEESEKERLQEEEEEEAEALGPTEANAEEIEEMLRDADTENFAEEDAEDAGDADGWDFNPSEEVDLTLQDSPADWPLYPAPEMGVNKEWLLNQYLDQTEPSIKRKRSGPVFEEIEELDEEDDDDVDAAVDILTKFVEFEDDQNDNLVQALNLATKGQTEQTDRYIPEQIQYIRKALDDEQALQTIKALVEAGDAIEEEEEAEAEAEAAELANDFPEEKRGGPINDNLDSLDEEAQARVAKAMAAALRRYFWENPEELQGYDDDEEEEEAEEPVEEQYPELAESVQQWYNAPIADEDEGAEDTEWELNPFYRELLEQYTASRMRKRGGYIQDNDELPYEDDDLGNAASSFLVGGDENPLLPITEADICPAVGLTDGCTWAEQQGLVMDAEARNLCNRHQLCYTCGALFGLSEEGCDEGYIGETDNICQGDTECRVESVELYVAMSSGHIYVPRALTHHTCRDPCTYDYIVGVAEKKR